MALALACLAPLAALAQQTPDAQALLRRINALEQRIRQLESEQAGGAAPSSAARAEQAPASGIDTQAILDRLDELDQRLSDLESTAVLSEPKSIVKRVTVYVDEDGNEYDQPHEGAKPVVTYQRETAFRRQSIDEELDEALAERDENSIQLGVTSVTTAQRASQIRGEDAFADGHTYGLSAADITFLANSAALYTTFFADIVGIGGSPPDAEINAINLLNSQTARLSNNQINLREAWVRKELAKQKLALSVGRLDLTNYFDQNAVAADEDSQFISDALVVNPVLGLTDNGMGIVGIYDPRGVYNVKLGIQQSTPTATSLSTALYTLAEVEFRGTPFSGAEGHYRLWWRSDNTTGRHETGSGVSFDQKLSPAVTLFGRYGSGFVGSVGDDMRFESVGVGFQAPFTFNPQDLWGVGLAKTHIDDGRDEKLAEAFYNFHLTGHLSLSTLLQYVLDSSNAAEEGYLLPGVRLEVGF
ncbi:MAG TPA: hypothetical protein VFV10_01100 [Gammaproteobacteria bacterium]|nr:hypothetical protein [Gammaproteobacteria bacterium]